MFRIRTLLPVLVLAAAAAACADAADAPLAAPGDVRLTTSATLTASPSNPASGDTVTVTASVSPSGSYYYRWTVQRCVFQDGEPEGTCQIPITVGGQDLTQRKFRVSTDVDWHISLAVRANSTSTTNLAVESMDIIGLSVQ